MKPRILSNLNEQQSIDLIKQYNGDCFGLCYIVGCYFRGDCETNEKVIDIKKIEKIKEILK